MPLSNYLSFLNPFKSTTGALPSPPAFKLRIYESEYRKIEEFVLRFENIETGGDLFGLWTRDGQPVIQLIIGPGEKCKRTSVSFHQDVNYLQNVGGCLNTSFMLCHMGSWHSHHQLSLTHPSSGDHSTVRNNFPTGLERYIMVIANIAVDGALYGKRVELHPYVFSCEGRVCEEGEVERFPCLSPFGEIDFVISKIVNGAEKTQNHTLVSQSPARYSQNRTEKSRFQELPSYEQDYKHAGSLNRQNCEKSPPLSIKHRIPKEDVTEQWYTLPEGEKKLKKISEEIMEMVQLECAEQNGEPEVSFTWHQKSRDLTLKFVHRDKTWCVEFPRSFDEEEAKIYVLQNSQKSDCIPSRNVIESVRLFCGCPNCEVLMNCRKEMKNGHGTEDMDIGDESNGEEPRPRSSSVEESDVINDESTTRRSDGDTREVNKGTQQWYETPQGQEKLKDIVSNLKTMSDVDMSRNKESKDLMLSFFYNHRNWTIHFPRFYDEEDARIEFVTEGFENSSSSAPVFSTDIINAVRELCSSAEYDLQEYVEEDKTTDQQLDNRENVSDTMDGQELRRMSHDSNVNQWSDAEEDKTADKQLAIRGNNGDTRDESDDRKRRRMSHDSNVKQSSDTEEDETTDKHSGIRGYIGDTRKDQELTSISSDMNFNPCPCSKEDRITDQQSEIRDEDEDKNRHRNQELESKSSDSILNQRPGTEENKTTNEQVGIRDKDTSKLGSQELTGLWLSKEEDETDGDYMQTIHGDLLESTNTSYDDYVEQNSRSESNFDSSWTQYPLNVVLNNSQGVVNRSAHETSFETADANTVDFTEKRTQQWYETLQGQEKLNEIHEDIVSKLKPTSDVEWSRGNESHDLILSFLYNHCKWTVHFPRSYDEEYARIDFVTHGIQNFSSSGSVLSKDIVNDVRELCSREKYDVEEYVDEEYSQQGQVTYLTRTVTTIHRKVTQLPNQAITKVREIPVSLEDESQCDTGMRSKVKCESEFTTQRTAENTNESPVGDDAQWYRNTDFPSTDYDSDLSQSSFSSEESGTRVKVKRESEIATQRTAENGNESPIGDNAQWCRNSCIPLTNYDSHMLESSLSLEVSGTRSNIKRESENTTLKIPQNADKSLIESQVEISGGTTDPAESDPRRNNLKRRRAANVQSLSPHEKRDQIHKMASKLRRFFKWTNEGALEEITKITNRLFFNHGKIDWLIEFRSNLTQSKAKLHKREDNGRSFCADVLPNDVVEVLKSYCGCRRCIPSPGSSAVVPAVSISPAVPPAFSSATDLSPVFSRFVVSPAVPSKVSPAFSATMISPMVSPVVLPKAPPAFSLVKVSPTMLYSFSPIVSKTATPSRSRNRRCKTSSRKFSRNT